MSFESRINSLNAEKKVIENDLKKKQNELQSYQEEKEAAEEARIILQTAARKTQQNIEIHFSDLVTKAMQLVFDNPYVFQPEFIEKRNKTECDLWFVKNNQKLRPRFASGGGALDVASFALRLAYWRLEKSAPVLILDEPFKNLSRNLMPKAVEMLKMLSNEFGLQIIMITHIQEIVEEANKVFKIQGGKSL